MRAVIGAAAVTLAAALSLAACSSTGTSNSAINPSNIESNGQLPNYGSTPTDTSIPTDTTIPTDTSQPTTEAPPPAPQPSVVLHTSGNGERNTAQFTTGDNWTISYSYDCSNFGQIGNFIVYVDYPSGDVAVNEYAMKGSNSSTETGAGTHTLKVSSECDWTVTVTDG